MSSLTKVKMSSSEDKKVDKLLTMSDKEVSRLEVMQRLKEKSLCLDRLDNQARKKPRKY